MRKILNEGIDDPDSFANGLTDSALREFVETFNFERHDTTTTIFERAQQGTVDRYVRQTLEEDAGTQNEGVRLALYFERKAEGVDSAVSTSGGSRPAEGGADSARHPPETIRTMDIDRQAELITSARHRGPEGPGEARQVPRALRRTLGDREPDDGTQHGIVQLIDGSSNVIGIDLLPADPESAERALSHAIEPLRLPLRAACVAASPRDHRQQRRQQLDTWISRRERHVRERHLANPEDAGCLLEPRRSHVLTAQRPDRAHQQSAGRCG